MPGRPAPEFVNTLYSAYLPGQTGGGAPLNTLAFGVAGGAVLNYFNTTQKAQGLRQIQTAFPSGPPRNKSGAPPTPPPMSLRAPPAQEHHWR